MKRVEELILKKGNLDEFLVEYNETIAHIFVDNFTSRKYRVSPSLNKLESQTHLYQRITYYITAVENLERNSTLELRADDHVLFTVLNKKYPGRIKGEKKVSNYVSFLSRFLFYMALTVYFSFFLHKRVSKKRYKNIVRTYFVPRSVDKDNMLRDEYLGAFTDDLMAFDEALCIYKLVDWHDWRKYQAAKAKDGYDFALVEHFLSIGDILQIFVNFLFSRVILEKVIFKGHDITLLVNEVLKEEYFRLGSLVSIVEEFAARRILSMKAKNVFYPFENQAWEKVYPFIRSLRRSKTRLIGFQHTGVSFKLLNYFPSRLEKNLPIYPDLIFTVGDIIKDILKEKAFFSSMILTGGAIRHAHFVEGGKIKSLPPRKAITKVITYAFSYDFGLYPQILKDLVEVFKGTDVKIYLKFHPLFTNSFIQENLSEYLGNNFVNALEIPWSKVYEETDFILYDDNTIGFEGMINGIKTFMYRDADRIYNCKRDYYFDVWEHEVGKTELFKLKEQLVNGTFDKTFDQTKLKAYLEAYFTPYIPKLTFQNLKSIYEA